MTIVGQNEIYNWEILSGGFWHANFWIADTPPPLLAF